MEWPHQHRRSLKVYGELLRLKKVEKAQLCVDSGDLLPERKTPHNARVISIAFVPAFVTPLEMAAQSGRATGCDGAQDTLLCWGQRGSMRLAKLFTMGAHDIGDF
jgi:hypothetical protein